MNGAGFEVKEICLLMENSPKKVSFLDKVLIAIRVFIAYCAYQIEKLMR